VVDSGSPVAPVKLVILPRTRVGLGREGLRRYLETVHGPMVMNEPDVSGKFCRYVHHYVKDVTEMNGVEFLQDRDAVTIICAASIADLGLSKANDGYRNRIGPDEDNFRQIEGSVALLADEFEVAPGVDDAQHKLLIFRNGNCREEAWVRTMGKIVRDYGLRGATTNNAKVIEGHFPYSQFDEIGLTATSDIGSLIAEIYEQAREHFGVLDTKLLYVESVRFI
jgi:EthD domain